MKDRLKIIQTGCFCKPKFIPVYCVLRDKTIGRTLEVYKQQFDTKLLYYMCFDCESFNLSQTATDLKTFTLVTKNFEISFRAETEEDASEWKMHIRSCISESAGLKFNKTLEKKYFSVPHYSLAHFFYSIKSFDLLMYKDGKDEYIGMILIKVPRQAVPDPLGVKRDFLYYSPTEKKYKLDPIKIALKHLRGLKLYKLMNYDLCYEAREIADKLVPDILDTHASAQKAMQDIIITPYEKLNILQHRIDPKKTKWVPADLLTKGRFMFKGNCYLDKGHIVLDENNRIL